MKILLKINLAILVLLAVSSGITKVMLMSQEVAFFSSVGFNDLLLIIFGISQVVGGLALIFVKTRLIGSIIVGLTFVLSAVVLFMASKLVLVGITAVTLVMLGIVMKKSIKNW